MPATEFIPGDVVFYSATGVEKFADLDPQEFDENFQRVAAFAQALPYVLAREIRNGGTGESQQDPSPDVFKPWFHVALVTERNASNGTALIAGFEEATSEEPDLTGLSESTFETDHHVIALRPPSTVDIARVIHKARQQATTATPYSVVGLLAFAIATQARALPIGDLRTALLNTAYGASGLARQLDDGAESCVTAVARAIQAGIDEHLRFAEPPALVATTADHPLGVQSNFPPELAAIEALLDRVLNRAGAPTDLPRSERVTAAAAHLASRGIDQAMLDGVLEPMGPRIFQPTAAGPIAESFAAYIDLLDDAIEAFGQAGLSSVQMRAIGSERRRSGNVLDAGELVVSPAMLFDRLIDLGYRRFDVLN